jgi:hypothetical protein
MTEYLYQLKWIITGKNEPEHKINSKSPDKFVFIDNNKNEFINGNHIENEQDQDHEDGTKYISDVYFNIGCEKCDNSYLDTNTNMNTQEITKSLYVDTSEPIDIKIINDFAIIMDSFRNIQNKITNFEYGIKEFESNIIKKTITQDKNYIELQDKIKQIDSKLTDTIVLIEQIKATNSDFMKKIIKLENIIKQDGFNEQEILYKLEKINLPDTICKKNNNQINLNNFFDLNYWKILKSKFNLDTDNMILFILSGSCVLGTLICINYFKKK